MIRGQKVLGIVPARGGSKGLPNKNILPVRGKPLISWTVEQAKKSKYLDRLIVTSDSQEIITAAEEAGCEAPFKRPDVLATDCSTSLDVVLHALKAVDQEYDYFVLLQPTSPLRSVDDIDACVEKAVDSGTSCVSLVECDKSPEWMFHLGPDDCDMQPLIKDRSNLSSRRQDVKPVYAPNGAVYVCNVTWFFASRSFIGEKSVGYVMPKERSIDIDTRFDFTLFETIVEKSELV